MNHINLICVFYIIRVSPLRICKAIIFSFVWGLVESISNKIENIIGRMDDSIFNKRTINFFDKIILFN